MVEVQERSRTLADNLARLRLFSRLSPPELLELANSLKRRSFRKGEVVYHQDDPPGSLFIVNRGTVKMQVSSINGKQITVGWIGPDNFFGTISFFGGKTQPDNAIAVEDCELLVLNRDDFRAFLHRHPDSAEVLLESVVSRWSHALHRLSDFGLDIPRRVAKVLLDFARVHGEAATDGSITIRNLTQPELASLVGATRESVNKALHSYSQKGWIEVDRGSIRITDRESLNRHLE
jgi:CRP/FNR family cyclic AMP-dependent transcriptional regulator